MRPIASGQCRLLPSLRLKAGYAASIGTACLAGLTARVRIGRGIAQPGRALSSGGRGRRFESSFPDHLAFKPIRLAVGYG
ncbi:MAG: hypothetical protein RL481_850 [Pseudomonadota bacterium]|jgi:hypothetical protein